MTATPRVNKRLTRFVKLRICPEENVAKYAEDLKKLAVEIVDSKTVKKQSKVFKALGDETRLRILGLLGIREMCVCEVMVGLGLTQPTASHHLGLLENVNLVKNRKEGKWVFYSIANEDLVKQIKELGIFVLDVNE